jgi:tetratricopeptide (TPR) repeat protein
MAPEQAGGAGSQSIDTRADVYALGAVLYELTCGRPPNDVKAGDPLEALRRIREVVPPPASSVLHRGDRGERGEDHQEDLARDLRGEPRWLLTDLDCILAKALEKEPARRYSTVAAFAEDLRRLLRREPIEARPPTLRYRAARFAQRNRVLVASIAIVLLAVLVGIAGLTAGLIEAKRQRHEADNQTDAQREINRFLTEDLLAGASPEREGQNVTALDLLHRASHRVEQRFAGRPLIAGAIHHTLGEAYSALGAFDDADRHLQRAIELRRAAVGPDAPDTLRSEILAASLLARRQKLPEAEAALTRVITRGRLILGANDPALYAALNDLGTVYCGLDRGKDAVNALQEALQGRVRLLGPNDPQVLVTMSDLADGYDRIGDTQRMLELELQALHLAEKLTDPPRMILLGLNNNVGATYQDFNEDEKARPYLEKAAELARGFLGEESPDTLSIELNLASLQAETGHTDEALALIDRVIEIRTRVLGPNAIDTLTGRMAHCSALWHGKRFAESAEAYQTLLPDIVAALGDDHWLAVQTRASLALALLDDQRPSAALPYAEKAVAQFTALYGADRSRTVNATKTLQTIKDLLNTPRATTQPGAEAPRSGDSQD